MSSTSRHDRFQAKIVPVDKDGQILWIVQDCDLTKVNKDWKICMEGHGFKRIVNAGAASKPREPTDALYRRDIEQEEEGDEKMISYYHKSMDKWDADFCIVVPSYTGMMSNTTESGWTYQ